MPCPLCESSELSSISQAQIKDKSYWHCHGCDLIFMSRQDHASFGAEKARYEHHQNSADNEGYLRFLGKLVAPVLAAWSGLNSSVETAAGAGAAATIVVAKTPRVLDYGCGPHPVLAGLFLDHGWSVENYDPYFFPREFAAGEDFDILLSTEVWEHFREPRVEIEKQFQLLRGGGFLGVMTQLHQGRAHFSHWWYARDFTHVVFYSEATFRWIAEHWGLGILSMENPVVLLRKANVSVVR